MSPDRVSQALDRRDEQGRTVKIAVRRRPGYPTGQAAPCFMVCPCGAELDAFKGDQPCACGHTWDENGWEVTL